MLQRTYTVSKIDEVNDIVRWISREPSCVRAKSKLLIVFICRYMEDRIDELLRPVRKALPDVQIVAASQYGFDDINWKKEIRMSFFFFRESEASVLEYDLHERSEESVAEALKMELKKTREARGLLLFSSGLSLHISRFLEEFGQTFPDLQIFGASAYIHREEEDVRSPYIYGRRSHEKGILAVIFSGEMLRIWNQKYLGWKPLGKEFSVQVRRDVEDGQMGDCIVQEIDGTPATEIYDRYLKVLPNESFLFNICDFPLTLERNGITLSRVPFRYDSAGELYFVGDIRRDEKLRFSYANVRDILIGSSGLARAMQDFGPDASLILSCGNRLHFLKENSMQEIDCFLDLNPEAQYGVGYSTFYFHGGRGGVMNAALVAVGMREGDEDEPEEGQDSDFVPVYYLHEDGEIPLSVRLTNFLEAITTDLRETNEKYLVMAERAEAANRAKSGFLSSMSHEIRTPINAVLGMDEMILRESNEPSVLRYAQDIRTAGTSLLGIINDILDFSKIEAGKMEIIPVEYNTAYLLKDLVNMIQKRAEDKGLSLYIDAARDIPKALYGDEIRIKQAVTNILTNAVKYTKEGSVKLSVSWQKLDDGYAEIRYSVSDTGIGIKGEDIKKLFNAFERIEEERNRTIEGTGLGLTITTQLLALMNSKLEVESVYGKGSTFSFRIRQKVISWDPIGNYADALKDTEETRKRDHEKFTAPDAVVLAVDDTVMNLTVIKGLLKRTRVQVEEAQSGRECMEMCRKKRYDIIFLDHRMPEMDGIETLHAMLQDPENRNMGVPVIALTANALSGAREEYLSAGFNDYLSKPVNTDQLESMMLEYLPKEKVKPYGPSPSLKGAGQADGGASSGEEDYLDEDQEEEEGGEEILPDWLRKLPDINVSDGIKFCGSAQNYLSALKNYVEAVPSDSQEIRKYRENNDIRGYTIKVHALKSSSRIIGAAKLSELAAKLEDAGNSGNMAFIIARTTAMLKMYEALYEELKPLLPSEEEEDPSMPEISEEELDEALATVKDLMASFAYDDIMYVLDEISHFRIPSKLKKRVAAIREAARKPDWDRLKEILK